MGAAVVGDTLGSLGIGEASADPPGCKRNGETCTRNGQCCSGNCVNSTCAACPSGTTPCGTSPSLTCCPEGQERMEGMCSEGEPICDPPCPEGRRCTSGCPECPTFCEPICPNCPNCSCYDRVDGTGTACVDCFTESCQGAPNGDCSQCPAGTICVVIGPLFDFPVCGNPCQPAA